MISNPQIPATDPAVQISDQDVASYIFQLSRELAGMAERHGMKRLAASLELARGIAAEELAQRAIHSPRGKAAPEEAA